MYTADQQEDNKFKLFIVAPDGSAVNARLSGDLTPGSDVLNFTVE
ncbi:MAG: hypothetical protein OEN20_08330 [Gammaproteobacteria bacterium]|nr:hypothetical protein [Gammaproteobacteria bacterium]